LEWKGAVESEGELEELEVQMEEVKEGENGEAEWVYEGTRESGEGEDGEGAGMLGGGGGVGEAEMDEKGSDLLMVGGGQGGEREIQQGEGVREVKEVGKKRERDWGSRQCKGKSRGRHKGGQKERRKEWVVLDLFAGTQSLRKAVEERGWIYVPVDIVGEVWSPEEGGVVENLEYDLQGVRPKALWRVVRKWLLRTGRVQRGVQVGLKFIWASPPCTTYTRLDSMQKEPYRFHEKRGSRPPMKGKGQRGKLTVKGKVATEADVLVQDILGVMEWGVKEMGAQWGMENPDAWLQCREFMGMEKLRQRGLEVQKHLVNYCNWGHIYFKGTIVWTSVVGWRPKGKSGNGKCGRKCGMGYWDQETGGYKHWHSIGQETWRLKRGLCKQGLKCMVPEGMHREHLSCVK